jgi:hypothetical protein
VGLADVDKKSWGMENRQSQRLRLIYDSLTSDERRELRAIVFGDGNAVTDYVIERLVKLGLVERVGALLVATNSGKKLARRC